MRPQINSWPNTNGSRGVLMFAQQMKEMLTPTTFESFRAYSLDTTARLREAYWLAEDVRKKRIPKAVLNPVVAELEWSFSKDSAVQELASNEVESLNRLMAMQDMSLAGFSSHIKLIRKLTSVSYKAKLEEIILSVFADDKQRIELRKLTGFYCSHLLNLGYKRRHILEVVDDSFFEDDVQRAGANSLKSFFKKFDAKVKKFVVHAGISEGVATYLKRLGFNTRDFMSLTIEQQTIIGLNPNAGKLEFALETQIDALDPHDAMEKCYQLFIASRSITYLDPMGMEFIWGDTMSVTRLRSKLGEAISKTDFLVTRKKGNSKNSRAQPRTISKYAATILENFNDHSNERMLSSIRMSSLARTSFNPENQLISLWSAIEVLLSEPDGQPRIVHYADLIVPCIAIRHIRRQVLSIYHELLISYRAKFKRLLRSIPDYKDLAVEQAFAEMMFLPEHEDLRLKLLEILTANPLALQRVYKLHNDYKTTKSAAQAISDHFDRVYWQIHRVYRARNQLVHAGLTPSYLESIILNQAEYYQSTIATIVSRAKREHHRADIDQVVAEVGIQHGIYQRTFREQKAANLDRTQIALLIDQPKIYL